MKISEIYKSKKPVISIEVFPPKPDYPLETVYATLDKLKELSPDFISVTYGAGGSTRGRTAEIASKVKNAYGLEALPHLTCTRHTKRDIDTITGCFRSEGIENILALKGDPPADAAVCTMAECDFNYAADLVRYLQDNGDFCIGAAAYPEGHIECGRIHLDRRHLKQKVDAGVDFLITQLFFDNRIFYEFIDGIRAMGITCPVSAGIMPILNAKQIKRITSLCGASIPARLLCDVIDKYQDNPGALQEAGIEYACRQIEDLIASGVEGIHLMTMNKPEQTKEILKKTGLR